jgi:glutathione S-transferase
MPSLTACRQPSRCAAYLKSASDRDAARKAWPSKRVVIDLAQKPDWFVAISTLGKVHPSARPLARRQGGRAVREQRDLPVPRGPARPAPGHPEDPTCTRRCIVARYMEFEARRFFQRPVGLRDHARRRGVRAEASCARCQRARRGRIEGRPLLRPRARASAWSMAVFAQIDVASVSTSSTRSEDRTFFDATPKAARLAAGAGRAPQRAHAVVPRIRSTCAFLDKYQAHLLTLVESA